MFLCDRWMINDGASLSTHFCQNLVFHYCMCTVINEKPFGMLNLWISMKIKTNFKETSLFSFFINQKCIVH